MTKTQKQKRTGWIIVSLFIVLLAVLLFKTDNPLRLTAQSKYLKTGSSLVTPGTMEVAGESVSYFNGVSGFYTSPRTPGQYPGVVMVHEWWGLNDNIREMAKILASHGYHVLAVDLFDGKVAKNMQEAQTYVGKIDQSEALSNMRSARSYLESKTSGKIGVLGWCFGGGQALLFSLDQKGLAASVIYYGQLPADSSRIKNITWPVLGIFGDRDASIPIDSVLSFEDALNKNKIVNEIYLYPGVGHAFANPSGANYAPAETKDAWEKTIKFLETHLK